MPKIKEYTVGEFIKLVSVCGENSMADLVGDLPALPYCFPKSECLQVGGVEVCWSDWLRLRGFSVRIESSTVEGVPKSISFHARGIKCDEVSEEIYYVVRDYILSKCSIDEKTLQL